MEIVSIKIESNHQVYFSAEGDHGVGCRGIITSANICNTGLAIYAIVAEATYMRRKIHTMLHQ